MLSCCLSGVCQADAHPLFERLSDEELEADLAACLLASATEEGQKVARNSGQVSVGCCNALVSFIVIQDRYRDSALARGLRFLVVCADVEVHLQESCSTHKLTHSRSELPCRRK